MLTPKEVAREPDPDEIEQARIEEELDLQLAAEWLIDERDRPLHLMPRYRPINVTHVLKKYKSVGWDIGQVHQPKSVMNRWIGGLFLSRSQSQNKI